ncbi:SDR family oxidoreductase [Roseomonas sp. OT10]|uniref:SDR family NAD(P)-dependent oxidoreductase n=1 Tax=Roseomonas cutis TaxID=2897332 RepID=UPI001E2C9F50|nr:SDR family NAD(P)-dependent oxidoreductase [Roseomonas sp. OT10]UFN48406.1 SDR family oxidoreductase [Roseomonas sp. OT10]
MSTAMALPGEAATPSPLPPPGTRVLVTGGAQGIGRAVADAFAARGARVCILDLGPVPDAPAGWITVRGSVADAAEVEGAFARMDEAWGGVDVAHANAGLSANKPTLELTEAEWRRTVEVNLTGAFLTAQAAGRRMVAQGSGLLLFTASLYHAVGGSGRAAYCGTKGGVANLARSLACEWAEHGVRVNALAPGYVETALVADLLARGRLDAGAIAHRSPQRRLVQPGEVAAMALFLASPAASSINGAVLAVDGGWTANGAP